MSVSEVSILKEGKEVHALEESIPDFGANLASYQLNLLLDWGRSIPEKAV